MGKFFDLFFELRELILLGFEQLLRSSNTFNLVLLLLALQISELSLVNLNKLVDVMQFLLHQLELLVQIGRRLVTLWQFGLIQYFIDSLAQLVELVSILLVLQFQRNDHLLVILLALPLLSDQLPRRVGFFGGALHISFINDLSDDEIVQSSIIDSKNI